MVNDDKELEREATKLLEKDAKEHHTTLRKEGILDERTENMMHRREVPFSYLEDEERRHAH